MKYYGIHFQGDDNTPIQVRVDTERQECWVRSCPKGEWTPWRRVDVVRNADGTLNEEVAEATHAKKADKAVSLDKTLAITFTGDVTGTLTFNGNEEKISVNLSAGDLKSRVSKLESRMSFVERYRDDDDDY